MTQKVVAAACRIANGSRERLKLGDLSVRRDWGWAPEYVEAMWGMLQQESASDYVICTGETNALSAFVEEAFRAVGLRMEDHVDQDRSLFRPTDIHNSAGSRAKAQHALGWVPKYRMREVVAAMIRAAREGIRESTNLR